MTLKELINKLNKYPDNAIVQINSKLHNFGSENINKITIEDEHNNDLNFEGQLYIDLIGE